MWVWASNIAAAMASTALGVAQALADPSITNPILKIGLSSLIGAAGAVQLTSIPFKQADSSAICNWWCCAWKQLHRR